MATRDFEMFFVGTNEEDAIANGPLWEYEEGAMDYAVEEGKHVFSVRVTALSKNAKKTFDGVLDKVVDNG